MTLHVTPREARELKRLLGLLQTHLESEIDSAIIPGTGEPNPDRAQDVENVRRDRRAWRAAERWVKYLEAQTR